jgi:hypothetical protein
VHWHFPVSASTDRQPLWPEVIVTVHGGNEVAEASGLACHRRECSTHPV